MIVRFVVFFVERVEVEEFEERAVFVAQSVVGLRERVQFFRRLRDALEETVFFRAIRGVFEGERSVVSA